LKLLREGSLERLERVFPLELRQVSSHPGLGLLEGELPLWPLLLDAKDIKRALVLEGLLARLTFPQGQDRDFGG